VERIEKLLNKRKEEGLYRTIRTIEKRQGGIISSQGKEYIDFSSNDYLGLSTHPRIIQAGKRGVDKWGGSASASRLLSGSFLIHKELEERVAVFKEKDKALIFNSGYQANIGIISALCRRGDVVFSDRLNHASIMDGILLSGANFFRFSHNDIDNLEYLLKRERSKFKQAFIIVETVFSMDGDKPPLKEIVTLKEKYNCLLIVDEAHATGIFGARGSGVVEEEGLSDRVDLIMGTFSKGLGSFGAYVAASATIINYLINFSHSFIYSTALPPWVIEANLVSLDLVEEEPFRRKALIENADFFRRQLNLHGFKVKGSSQIVPLILGDTCQTVRFAERLQEKGYWVFPIRPPTVPRNEARLRFSINYYHSKKIIQKLIDTIEETLPV
jgi:8-amino-7-oxononanoate synthase